MQHQEERRIAIKEGVIASAVRREMSNTEVYVAGGLSRLLLNYLDEIGLEAPGLRNALTRFNDQSRMPIHTWWGLLDNIEECQPIPALGVHIGRGIRPHHLGVLGYLAASCANLGQAMVRFQRFQPLLHNLSSMRIKVDAQNCIVSWDPDGVRSTRISNEIVVTGIVALARGLTGKANLVPVKMSLQDAAPPGGEAVQTIYARLLGCPIEFGAPLQSVTFSNGVLDLPINSRDPHLQSLLDQQAEALLQVLPQPDAFIVELRRHLVESLQQGEPTLDWLANRMHSSPRTLHRRLEQRGLSFKVVLDELRYQLARRYLADQGLSLPEIALLLGYSEQSAFTRAFKRWSGTTPLIFRKSARRGAIPRELGHFAA